MIILAIAACGGGQKPAGGDGTGGGGASSAEYGCVVGDQDPDACVASGEGCSFGPPMWCAGVAPPPDWDENRANEPCECTCQADIERCSLLP